MILTQLNRPDAATDVKLNNIYIQFNEVLKALGKRELPDTISDLINLEVAEINTTPLTGNDLRKLIKVKQTNILKLVEKQLKLVPKSHYLPIWTALGMAAFGLPLGLVFASAIDNMGLMSVGLPIGLAIGVGVGSMMDKKAAEEGRQLDVVIKH